MSGFNYSSQIGLMRAFSSSSDKNSCSFTQILVFFFSFAMQISKGKENLSNVEAKLRNRDN